LIGLIGKITIANKIPASKTMKLTAIILMSIFLIFCILGVQSEAQYNVGKQSPNFFSNMLKPAFSILNPERLSMTQSYTFSYYSGSGRSGSIGMLMNSIEYQVSNPLKITVDLGLLHNPSAFVGQSRNGISPVIVPGLQLQYKPANNLFFQFNFQSFPSGCWDGGDYPGYYGGSANFWNR